MRTKVFAHKGVIGIQSDVNAEGLLNKPLENGQLGFVIDAKFVDISQDALILLKEIKRSCDDIGDVDIYKSGDKVIFSWLGGPLKGFRPSEVSGSNSYDASVVSAINGVETPEDFMAYVNALSDKR